VSSSFFFFLFPSSSPQPPYFYRLPSSSYPPVTAAVAVALWHHGNEGSVSRPERSARSQHSFLPALVAAPDVFALSECCCFEAFGFSGCKILFTSAFEIFYALRLAASSRFRSVPHAVVGGNSSRSFGLTRAKLYYARALPLLTRGAMKGMAGRAQRLGGGTARRENPSQGPVPVLTASRA